MSNFTLFPRVSVQTKVLIPVLLFLVLMPAITLWIVDDDMRRQMQTDSEQTLGTADTVFLKLVEIRAGNLVTRYSDEVNDPRFRAAVQSKDPRVVSHYQGELLGKFIDDEITSYYDETGALISSWRKDSSLQMEDFEKSVPKIVRSALGGNVTLGSTSFNGKVYLLVAVPVTVAESGSMLGVLVVANRVGENAAQEFKSLTNTEVVLISGDKIAASTLQSADLRGTISEAVANSLKTREHVATPIQINSEHFQSIYGTYNNGGSQAGFRYMLLSSYEQKLLSHVNTRRSLMIVALIGILLSGTVVWIMVRRVISPLLELRDTAEEVGRGNFERRIERFSNDECGDLAQAFNRMTENLQVSHSELEKSVASLKNMQAQLVQSEKLSAVGQFVAGVAHELNNPLTAVIGFSDLLLLNHSEKDDEKTHRQISLIAKSAHRCHKIVQNLLGFARQHIPERKLVRVNTVVDEVIDFMAYDLSTSNLTITTHLTPDLPQVMADSHQLQQVLVNIISNARQAIQSYRKDGTIVLRTKKSGSFVHIDIEDNGPGISPKNLARLFDPFFTTKPAGKGTGLGLSLSYGIVQEHGGRITVQSHEGLGTTFTIELPSSSETTQMSLKIEPPVAQVHAKQGAGLSVLVVDDEEWIRDLIRALLERDGYTVETSGEREFALKRIREKTFDVFVLDWKMPGEIDGMKFYDEIIATNPEYGHRVVFMSGDVIGTVFKEFLERNGKTCLSKPFEIEAFRHAVTNATKLL